MILINRQVPVTGCSLRPTLTINISLASSNNNYVGPKGTVRDHHGFPGGAQPCISSDLSFDTFG
jgi:hypothetical protein